MLYMGIFRLEFGNTIIIFEISTPDFFQNAKFQNKKKLNLRQILKYLNFGLEFDKTIVIFEFNTVKNC